MIAWGTLTAVCLLVIAGAIALGLVAMSTK
jgi:hypothetical protein